MALSKSALKLIAKEVVPAMPKTGTACILGFPRLRNSREELSEVFGVSLDAASFAAILKGIGFGDQDVLDVSDYEKPDMVADLNFPLPDNFGKYDLVVDNGTIEHVFNIGQAMMNCASLCAVGGVIFHYNPANWFNHGFYNLSPAAYFDFYQANGFEVRVFLRDCGNGAYRELQYKPKVTKILQQKRYVIHAVAKRIEEQPLKFPMQARYAEHIWQGSNVAQS